MNRLAIGIAAAAVMISAFIPGAIDPPVSSAAERGIATLSDIGGGPGPVPAVRKPVRGVWLHPGQFGPEREKAVVAMRETFDAYVRAGIDTLVIMVKGTSGYVFFESETGTMDPSWSWDFFDDFYKEARARSLTVHPWFCVFPESDKVKAIQEHPEWLILSRTGETRQAANPALPAARAYEIGLMTELARRYPDLGWLHMDYIRYPCDPLEPDFSFDPETQRLFREHSGIDLADVKARDTGNMIWNEWLEWNRDQVTVFLRELREDLRAMGRTVRISAAVFPDPTNAAVMIGQDWPRWAAEGLVDMLCPMLYTNHLEYFKKYGRRAVEAGGGRSSVCLGIGVATSHNRNTPEGMAAQMAAARELGADGVIFFSGGALTEPFLSALEKLK